MNVMELCSLGTAVNRVYVIELESPLYIQSWLRFLPSVLFRSLRWTSIINYFCYDLSSWFIFWDWCGIYHLLYLFVVIIYLRVFICIFMPHG